MDKILRVCKSQELPPLYDRDPNYIYFVYDKMRLHFYQSFYTDPFSIVESMPPKEDAVENMLYIILDGTMKTYIDYSIIDIGTIEDPAQIELLKQAGTIYFMNAESRYLDWQKRTLELPFQNGSYQLTLNLMRQLKIDKDTIIRFNEETNQFYIAGKEYQPDNRLDNIGKLGASYTTSVRTTVDQYRNWVKSDIRLAPDEDNDLLVKWNGLFINVSDHATQEDFDQLISAYQTYRAIINSYINELKDALQQVTGAVSNDTIGEKVLHTLETYKSTIDDMFDKYEDLAERTAALELESTSGVDMRIEQIKQEIINYINGLQHPWEQLNPDLNPPLEYTLGETQAQKLLIEAFRQKIIALRLLQDMQIVVITDVTELPNEEVEATYIYLFNGTANTFQEYVWEETEYVPIGEPVTYATIVGADGDEESTGGGVEGTDPLEIDGGEEGNDTNDPASNTGTDTNGDSQGSGGDPTDPSADPADPQINSVDSYNLLPAAAEEGTIYEVLNDWTDENEVVYPAGRYIYTAGMWLQYVPPVTPAEPPTGTVATYNLLPTDVADGSIYTVEEDWLDENTNIMYLAEDYIFTDGVWIVYEENGGDGDDSTDDSGDGTGGDITPVIRYDLTETEKSVQTAVFEEFDNVRLIMKYYEEYSSVTQLPHDGTESEYKTYYVIQHGRHFIIDNNDGTYSSLRLNFDGTVTIGEPVTDTSGLTKDTIYHIYQYESASGYVLVYNANNNYEDLPDPGTDPDPGIDPVTDPNTVETYNLLPSDATEGDIYTVTTDWTDTDTDTLYAAGQYIFTSGSWVVYTPTTEPDPNEGGDNTGDNTNTDPENTDGGGSANNTSNGGEEPQEGSGDTEP